MIDTHAHLYFDAFDADRDEVLARARAAGVTTIINVGVDVPTSGAAVDLALRHPWLRAVVGLQPNSTIEDLPGDLRRIEDMVREHPRRVVAVGEIGLDFHWKDTPREAQEERLVAQLELALRVGLPVVFHCREALPELLALLRRQRSLPPGVFHCYSGDAAQAEEALALGFHLSLAGTVTYPKADALREVAARVPLDRLVLETDSPFLPPQGHRGKRNEPALVRCALEQVAAVRAMSAAELDAATTATARRLFGIE